MKLSTLLKGILISVMTLILCMLLMMGGSVLLGHMLKLTDDTWADAWEYSVGPTTFTTKDQQLAESFRTLRKELEELKDQLNACSRKTNDHP